jgi:hypothetical protein
MPIFWTALAAWILLLALFIPYVRRVRHPSQKPLAAYLIFVTIFTAASFACFILLSYIVSAADWAAALGRPLPIVLFLCGVFLPAFLLASWQSRKPPKPSPRI